jgi:precorrin-3B synthase
MMRSELPTFSGRRCAVPVSDPCPGILALHPARDGHVARIRLPGGYVTQAQWAALAALAADLGDGHLDLTARGNVQIRGLAASAAAGLSQRAAQAGLLPSGAHDRSRNITASPLAGLGGRPPLVTLVRALDAAIVADPVLAALPGRFLFAADDGTGGAALGRSDIGLRLAGTGHQADPGHQAGTGHQAEPGREAELVVAGRLTGVRIPLDTAVAALVAAASAAVAGGVGHAVSRVADLPDGGACVAAAAGGSLGPRVSVAEDRLPLGRVAWVSVPLPAGSPPARRSGDPRRRRSARHGPAPGTAAGRPVVVVAAALGRLDGAQAGLIGELLGGADVLRLAAAGRAVIPLAPGTAPADALARLSSAGLLTSDLDPLAGVTACSGTACHRAAADVRALARPLPGHRRTHWVACPRGCGRPQDADLVVAAGQDLFAVAGRPAAALDALLNGAS